MTKKKPDADTPDPIDADTPDERSQAETPPDVHAHLGPLLEPQFNAATDDPAHPLHHHAKRDSLESPPSED